MISYHVLIGFLFLKDLKGLNLIYMKKANNNKGKKAKISFKLIKANASTIKEKTVILLTLAVISLNLTVFLVPMPAWAELASLNYISSMEGNRNIIKEINIFSNFSKIKNKLPESEALEVSYTRNVVFTAYNSEVGQCDSTPCITANGFNLCEHGIEDTIAMNGIKMGTKIRVPELFGDQIFVVRDRMNSRYGSDRGDVWMLEKQEAKEFGVKLAKIEVLK